MNKQIKTIREFCQKQIEILNESIDKLLWSNDNDLYIILRINTETLFKSSFEMKIYQSFLEVDNDNDLISLIEHYLKTIETQTYGNIMPSTTSMIMNITAVWKMEVMFSMKKTLERWMDYLK